jgi:hypothetical protein
MLYDQEIALPLSSQCEIVHPDAKRTAVGDVERGFDEANELVSFM